MNNMISDAKRKSENGILENVAKVLVFSLIVSFFAGIYFMGLFSGYVKGRIEAQQEMLSYQINYPVNSLTPAVSATPTYKPISTKTPTRNESPISWGGPELWEAVNKKRIEYGVSPLNQRDELCTIASIRLNELLELATLDGHQGFSNMKEARPDLEWIFDKYSVIAEFLALGGDTADETVSLWDNTLGHKKLLTGGEYVWGCVYAQNTFAVAITAY